MRNLLVRPWRFNELMKSLDGISQKILTESLRSMEDDGIIKPEDRWKWSYLEQIQLKID